MNGPLQGLVWNAKLPNNHKFLLALMAWYADSKGERIFPSVGTLAEQLNRCDRQVRRILRELEEAGYVERMSSAAGHGSTNHYRMVPESLYPLQRKTERVPATGRTFSRPGHSEAVGRTSATCNPDISRTTPDIQMSAKIAIEHETEIENTAVAVWELVSTHLKAKASAIKSQIDGGEPDPTRIDTQRYRTYISTLHAVSLKDEMLILGVPHSDFAAMLERFKPRILDAAKECGAGFTDIEFVIRTGDYE